MSNAKQKADELIEKFASTLTGAIWTESFIEKHSKRCALIAVEVMLNELSEFHDAIAEPDKWMCEETIEEWKEVKEELSK